MPVLAVFAGISEKLENKKDWPLFFLVQLE
jgi:hypothetical protein